tara:strand:- start:6172 stop:6579 length:408 start_codon:yes stop_codon:yes gene_type:complete
VPIIISFSNCSIGESPLIKKTLLLFSVSFLVVLVIGGLLDYWPYLVASVYCTMSSITFLVYKWDKRLAIESTDQPIRVPERSLHILALICGWPGALIAQQWLRHKSQKRAFIAVLWLTIIINTSLLGAAYYWQLL